AEVLGGREPSYEDASKLPYTRQVIDEAMRLYPPVYALVRDAMEDDEIGGYRIQAGSGGDISPYVTPRHPEVVEGPAAFRPERFEPARAYGRQRFAYFPFLGGPHQCIGQQFALLEATLVLAMVAQVYRLNLVPASRVEPRPMLSLRPRFGMPMVIH